MTVLEAIKKYNLENMAKRYIDQFGTDVGLDIPVAELRDKPVKSVTIYPFYDEAEITIVHWK